MAEQERGAQVTVAEQSLSDRLLLQRARAGDALSFDVLFHRYYDRVYGVLFRLVGNRGEAEDLLQEVFLTLYRQPPAAKDEANLAGWLYRVATNRGYNHLRGQRRRWRRNMHLVPGSDPTLMPSGTVDPADIVARDEQTVVVRAALCRLSRRDVQLLLLRQMGLSYRELAEACEIAPGSVGKLLSRAVEAFRRSYEKQVAEQENAGG
jgi:RNA polymerase sigma-70 factor (ECF subfamily)